MFVVFMSVPPILDDPLPVAPPVNPAPEGTVQLYIVPAGTIPSVTFTGVTINPEPLHTEADMLLIAGFGLIITLTGNASPVQLPETGVTV